MLLSRWRTAPDPHSLDHSLLVLSKHKRDRWTLRDACEGTQIFGATGSGKTSGSGRAIAHAFLRSGYGGLVLTAKADEADLWRRYCQETGREDDLVVMAPGNPWALNILDYEYRRHGATSRGAGLADNIANLLSTVLELGRPGKSQSSTDPFWTESVQDLVANTVELMGLADVPIGLDQLLDIATSAPRSRNDLRDPAWHQRSACWKCLATADERELSPTERETLDRNASYWSEGYLNYPEKTRGSIEAMLRTMSGRLLRQPFLELFCRKTTFTPEQTHAGKILVVDLPVKEFADAGRYAQVLMKLIWQRAAERRAASGVEQDMRPAFLWCDEAHLFVTPGDVMFQTTARSARACTVYLTQNISNYLDALGGVNAQAQADALLGSLNTKLFHANSDPATNRWAAELFAQSHRMRVSTTEGLTNPTDPTSPGHATRNSGSGLTEQLEYEVPPATFKTLAMGGPAHHFRVEAIAFRTGRIWDASGATDLRVEFKQIQHKKRGRR